MVETHRQGKSKPLRQQRFVLPKLLFRLQKQLSQKRKKQFKLLIVLVLLNAAAEVISFGAILPFLNVVLDQESIKSSPYIGWVLDTLEITDNGIILLLTTVTFITLVITSSAIKIVNIRVNCLFSGAIASDISKKTYRNIIDKDYTFHIEENSSKLVTSLTSYVNKAAATLDMSLTIITNIIVSIFLVTALMIYNFKITLSLVSIICVSYLLLMKYVKSTLRSNSKKIATDSSGLVKIMQESFGSIREIKLYGASQNFLEKYVPLDERQKKLSSENKFLGRYPKFVIESLGISTIILLAYFSTLGESNTYQLVADLGVYGLGSQKLLPTIQQIYANWAQASSYTADLSEVIPLLENSVKREYDAVELKSLDSIELENVSYKYPKSDKLVIKNLSLKIKKGERIGIVGPTGSGKSTLTDLILGLLKPTSGEMIINRGKVDQLRINSSSKPINNLVSHVPQRINLFDGTIADNIAFGVRRQSIDQKKLMEVIRMANLGGFVETLDKGVDSVVGENGVNLSGGQIQRIAIARALYKDCKILVLDEVTSALDKHTEKQTMDCIYEKVPKDVIIILIAHRINTLEKCDKVISLVNGEIEEYGSPSILL